MPLRRTDLITDVLHKRLYGDISDVWQLQGHIFVATDEGRKLFTFDCKPLNQHHLFGNQCLDLSVLSTPLVDVLMLSSDMIALIDTAGLVMFWRFTSEYSWLHEGNIQICTSSGAEILSVAYISGCSTLFWCEKQPTEFSRHNYPTELSSDTLVTFLICKRELCSDMNPQKTRELTQSSVFIKNCPSADVHAVSNHLLFIATQFHSEQVTIHMAVNSQVNKHLSLFIGEECIDYPIMSANDVVDFQEAVMFKLSVLMQTEPGHGDCGMRIDSMNGQVAVLHSNGQLKIYTCNSDSGRMQISTKMVTLSNEYGRIDKVDSKHWFLHRGHIGIVYGSAVRFCRVEDGKQVGRCTHSCLQHVQKVITSSSPMFLAWLLTPEHLFALKGIDTHNKEMYTAVDKLPNDHLLQTETLRLSHLHELRMCGYNQTLIKELEQLKDRWNNVKNLLHHSHVSDVIAPYMEEFWRLENLSQVILDSEMQTLLKAQVNSAQNIVKALLESRCLSKSTFHAKLLWLSEVHPQELLDCLCHGVTVDRDVVLPSEMKKWQSLLGMDHGDLMKFEAACRLFFRLLPLKLLNFVKCAESVSEQTIGVSAFVRKKHSLIYYKTAWECLPHCQTSCDPNTAASVKAKLILASEHENYVERALKYLLHHGLWSEAVELLKEQTSNEGLPEYLHITMKALAESHVLSKYLVNLIALMPSWKSFISFYQLATERPDIRQQQLSNSVKDVLCHDGLNIKFVVVRPFLQNLIKKGSDGGY
ncbi:hypothetical protein BsWGS_02613 [Bradybaena similaris]